MYADHRHVGGSWVQEIEGRAAITTETPKTNKKVSPEPQIEVSHLTFADPQHALKVGLDLAAVARKMIERREAEANAQAEG